MNKVSGDFSKNIWFDLETGKHRLKLGEDGTDTKTQSVAIEIIPKKAWIFTKLKGFILSLLSRYWKEIPNVQGCRVFVNIKSAAKAAKIIPVEFIKSKKPLEDIKTAYVPIQAAINTAKEEASMIDVSLNEDIQAGLKDSYIRYSGEYWEKKGVRVQCVIDNSLGKKRALIFGPDGISSLGLGEKCAYFGIEIFAKLYCDKNGIYYLKFDPKKVADYEIEMFKELC